MCSCTSRTISNLSNIFSMLNLWEMAINLRERYRKTPFIDFNKPVQQLGGIPDWTVRDTASLWLKVEHVVSVLCRLRTLAQVELVELDGTAERVLVILVLLVHLSVLGLLAFRRGWVISEQDGALLLPRLVG